MVKKLLLFAILSPLAMQPVMKANFLTETATKIGKPWAAGKDFNKRVELGLGVIGLGMQFYDFYKPGAKSISWLKKALAVNEFYRVGTTFRGQSHNYIGYSLSIMRMLGLFGSKIAEGRIESIYTKAGLPSW